MDLIYLLKKYYFMVYYYINAFNWLVLLLIYKFDNNSTRNFTIKLRSNSMRSIISTKLEC